MKITKFIFFTLLILFFYNCESKFVYLNEQDTEILKLIETEQSDKLVNHFGNSIEFDYGTEAYSMFSLEADKKEFLSGKKSEYYKFIFELDPVFKEKNWLSFKEALEKSYRVQGESKDVNNDKTFNRYIHIFTDKSYNRIGLVCKDDKTCKINNFYISSSKAKDVNL